MAGTSAGSIIATLIGAGASPDKLLNIMQKMDFEKFMGNPLPDNDIKSYILIDMIPILKSKVLVKRIPKLEKLKIITVVKNCFRYLGRYDASYISEWVDEQLRDILKKNSPVLFEDLNIPTSVVATDIQSKKVKIWSTHETPKEKVGLAVQASCTIPFFFQPYLKKYVDGGLISNLPTFIHRPESTYNKILAFSLFSSNKQEKTVTSLTEYIKEIVNTIIDGAVDTQQRLRDDIHLISIDTLNVEATDFKTITQEDIKALIDSGKTSAHNFFKNEMLNIKPHQRSDTFGKDIVSTFNFIVQALNYKANAVYISDEKTAWLYSLFPLFLKWSYFDKTLVKILLKKNGENANERNYKLRLCQFLGFEAQEIDDLPFKGFVIDVEQKGFSVIFESSEHMRGVQSQYYSTMANNSVNSILIKSFLDRFVSHEVNSAELKIEEAVISEMRDKLKEVQEYSGDHIEIEFIPVEVDKVVFLNNFVKGYKFRQMKLLFTLFQQQNVNPGYPLKITSGDRNSFITSPVLELHGDKLIVIEGSARFLYAKRNEIKYIYSFVIKNVSTPLPIKGDITFSIDQVLVSDRQMTDEEWDARFDQSYFRYIEKKYMILIPA